MKCKKREEFMQKNTAQKRKYKKHDYISDLLKKAHFWQSMSKSKKYVITPELLSADMPISKLNTVKEGVENYLKQFCQNSHQLLTENSQIQTLYSKLEELCTQTSKFQIEGMQKLLQNNVILTHYDFGHYVTLVELLDCEKKAQQKRIKDIQAYITFTQKQIEAEKKRLNNKNENKGASSSLLDRLFSSTRSAIFKFSNPRYRFLKKVVKREKKEIKDIELDLQKKAKEILQSAEKEFTPESQQKVVQACKEIKKMLKEGNALVGYLSSKLIELKRVVSIEKQKKEQENSSIHQNQKEKSLEEKLQDAFTTALKTNQNLVIQGKNRSLGLTNSVIKEIMEDEEFGQDIIEHISGLLDTPQGQDFSWSGSSRWKQFKGSNGTLYELSVNPKTGHSQSMPRLYAKKEIFNLDGELTNNKDKGQTETTWVLVKKGSKRTQGNDKHTTEKVHFKNDGEPHKDALIINDLGWIKISICPGPQKNLPVVAIVKQLTK